MFLDITRVKKTDPETWKKSSFQKIKLSLENNLHKIYLI